MDLLAAFRTLIRVAETGSFSAVAREMDVTQPSGPPPIGAAGPSVPAERGRLQGRPPCRGYRPGRAGLEWSGREHGSCVEV